MPERQGFRARYPGQCSVNVVVNSYRHTTAARDNSPAIERLFIVPHRSRLWMAPDAETRATVYPFPERPDAVIVPRA